MRTSMIILFTVAMTALYPGCGTPAIGHEMAMQQWVGRSEATVMRKWKDLEVRRQDGYRVLVNTQTIKIPDSKAPSGKDAIDKTATFPTPDSKGFEVQVQSKFFINDAGVVEKWEIVKNKN